LLYPAELRAHNVAGQKRDYCNSSRIKDSSVDGNLQGRSAEHQR
jgi:hypothetical protein